MLFFIMLKIFISDAAISNEKYLTHYEILDELHSPHGLNNPVLDIYIYTFILFYCLKTSSIKLEYKQTQKFNLTIISAGNLHYTIFLHNPATTSIAQPRCSLHLRFLESIKFETGQ